MGEKGFIGIKKNGLAMFNDFNNGTIEWTDWTIHLDENGGPNHVGNFCFSPNHGNIKTGELIYTPSYYFIGHFSKLVQKAAKKINCVTSRSNLIATSFLNPDGKVIKVVMNQSSEKIKYHV